VGKKAHPNTLPAAVLRVKTTRHFDGALQEGRPIQKGEATPER
jgi:hypothetical protein